MDNRNLRAAILSLATNAEARANFENNPNDFAASHNLTAEEMTKLQNQGDETVWETMPRPSIRRYSW